MNKKAIPFFFPIAIFLLLLFSSARCLAQLDTAGLSSLFNASKDKTLKQSVFLVYTGGKIVYKKEAGDFNVKTQQPLGAASQWLTTALVMTFVQEGKEQRQFVEANPQFKSITVYDGNMQRVNNQVQKEKESQGQSTKQDAKKEVKAGDDEGEAAPRNGQKSKKKKGISVS